MHVRTRLALAWIVATVASVLVAFAAVGSVRSAIAESPSAMRLPAGEAASQGPAIPPTTVTTTGADLEATDGPPATGPTDSGGPATAGDDDDQETTATPVTTVPDESSTTVAGTQTTGTTRAPVNAVESYELDGGWVSLRSTSEGVFLESASPKSGWTVEVEKTGPEQVKLEFKDGSHEIQFTAEFGDGRVKIEIDD